MQFVPYRLLRNQPKQLREKLIEEGELVVTNNGEPFALMLDVQPDQIEETLYLIAQLRAQRAVSNMRSTARVLGLENMAADEINQEIQAVRQGR